MIRRFNYTGRKKIPRSAVRIRVNEHGGRRFFDAEFFLDALAIPKDAKLFVEAYYRSAYRRFDFGTVADPQPPSERFLDGIPVRNPLFRVKAVVPSNGIARIVAAAEKVVPEQADRGDEQRQSLLPVEYVDLGDRIWLLDLDSDWPLLRLNSRFEGIREAARSGIEFLTLVYPELFRTILTRAVSEGRFDPDADDDDWGTLWLRFACRELGRPRPPEPNDGDVTEWIEDAVNAFCVHTNTAQRFEQLLAGRSD